MPKEVVRIQEESRGFKLTLDGSLSMRFSTFKDVLCFLGSLEFEHMHERICQKAMYCKGFIKGRCDGSGYEIECKRFVRENDP